MIEVNLTAAAAAGDDYLHETMFYNHADDSKQLYLKNIFNVLLHDMFVLHLQSN